MNSDTKSLNIFFFHISFKYKKRVSIQYPCINLIFLICSNGNHKRFQESNLLTLLCDMSKGPLDKKYQSINFLFHLQTKSSMHLNEAGYWM